MINTADIILRTCKKRFGDVLVSLFEFSLTKTVKLSLLVLKLRTNTWCQKLVDDAVCRPYL